MSLNSLNLTFLLQNVSDPLKWLDQALLSQITKTMSVYIVMGTVGFLGNLLCIVVMLSHAPLRRKTANYFLISQSVIDLLVSLMLPLNTTLYIPATGWWALVVCYLWSSRALFLGMFLASLFNITALTVERFFKTVYPIQHRNWMTKTKLIVIIVIVSIAGVLMKMPYAVGGTSYRGGFCIVQKYSSNRVSIVVGVYNFLVEYFVPLMVIAFCYSRMVRSVRKIRQTTTTTNGPASDAGKMGRAGRSILKTLLIVVLLFIACTTFKQILLLLKVIESFPLDYSGVVFNVSQVMSFMVCCTNPFVYIFHYEEFKVGLKRLFLRKSKAAQNFGATTQVSMNPTTINVRHI